MRGSSIELLHGGERGCATGSPQRCSGWSTGSSDHASSSRDSSWGLISLQPSSAVIDWSSGSGRWAATTMHLAAGPLREWSSTMESPPRNFNSRPAVQPMVVRSRPREGWTDARLTHTRPQQGDSSPPWKAVTWTPPASWVVAATVGSAASFQTNSSGPTSRANTWSG